MKYPAPRRLILPGALLLLSLALLLLSLALSAPVARAQTAPPAQKQPELSAAQKSKMEARSAKMRQSVEALKADKSLTDTQKQQKFGAMNKQFQADMLAILTATQRTQLKQQAAAAQKSQQAFTKAHQTEIATVQTTAKRLDASLTASQKQQMQAIQQQTVTERQKVIADTSLSDAAKRQRLETLSKEAQDKVMTLMTPTQKADMTKILTIQKSLTAAAQKS